MSARQFDRAYFDRWYRHPVHRVKSAGELSREVEFVLRATEHILGRAVRTVLDVGCGEGNWYPVLAERRPALRYTGVDPSEYAVRQWTARRHIRRGSIGDLGRLGLDGPFDLIISSGVLNYLTPRELTRGLREIAALLGGVAYLELYTDADAVIGDTRDAPRRSAAWYRRATRRAGLVACGLHLYVGSEIAPELAELERPR